jgi:uncharacterized protein YicC (UPF0701 family)
MALRSMTGFGVAVRAWDAPGASTSVHVEVRSVNGRFRDIRIRQPFGPAAEHHLRQQIESRLGRGKIELRVQLQAPPVGDVQHGRDAFEALSLDPGQVRAVLGAAQEVMRMAEDTGVALRASTALEVLRFLASGRGGAEAQVSAPPFLGELVDEALDGLRTLQAREGAALMQTLAELVGGFESRIDELETILSDESERLEHGLFERVTELCQRVGVESPDPVRLAQEVALLIVRGDVSEELARIRSHVNQFREVLATDPSPGQGKILDFLCQELIREVTTIGGKISSHAGSTVMIGAKSTIERIREQVQNVE